MYLAKLGIIIEEVSDGIEPDTAEIENSSENCNIFSTFNGYTRRFGRSVINFPNIYVYICVCVCVCV